MPERRPAVRRALVRNVAVLIVAVAVIIVAAERRFEDNPRRIPVEALTSRMDTVFDEVRAGTRELPDRSTVVDPGTAAGGEPILGVRTARDRWVLVGEANDRCYAVWWGPDGRRRPRIVADERPCTPELASSDDLADVAASGLASRTADGPARWDSLLPANTSVKPWWIPLVIVAGWLALSASTRLIVIVVTRGRMLAQWSRPA